VSRGGRSFGNDPDLFHGYASTLSRHLGIAAPLAVVVTGPDVRTDRDSAGEDGRGDGDDAGCDRDGCRDLVPPGLRPTPLGARVAGARYSRHGVGCVDFSHDGCRFGRRI